MAEQNRASTRLPLWRKLLPFLLAAGLVTYVLARIDWSVFVEQLAAVNYPLFLLFMLGFVLGLLSADTLATVYVYNRIAPVPFKDLFLVRAASYLPSLLNHHIGQAWLTYLLSRVYRLPLQRVAGGTLLVYVTWGGCILSLAAVALAAAGFSIRWMLAPLVLGLLYLLVVWLKPARLARISFLEPLFDAGPLGHIVAMVLRLPHMAVLFVGTWVPFLFFGVDIPLRSALIYIPALMVVVALPLTPVGVGTRDALAAQLLQGFVTGADSAEERIAILAASTTTVAVVLTLIDAIIGLTVMRSAARLIPRPSDADASRALSVDT